MKILDGSESFTSETAAILAAAGITDVQVLAGHTTDTLATILQGIIETRPDVLPKKKARKDAPSEIVMPDVNFLSGQLIEAAKLLMKKP